MNDPRLGRDGRDGRDGKQGPPGRDGKDADTNFVRTIVRSELDVIPRHTKALGDNTFSGGPAGPQGPRGPEGPPGEDGSIGPMPRHEWDDYRLRFEREPNVWGPWSESLRGPQGQPGFVGGVLPSSSSGGSAGSGGLILSSSTSNAVQNSADLQALLSIGGMVSVAGGQGSIPISGMHVIRSNTTLTIGPGTTLQNYTNLSGDNVPMFVNEHWQSTQATVTSGITDAATSPSLAGMRLATADCGANAHGLAVGDWALIKGDTTNRYVGVHQVESVTNAFVFTFLIPGPVIGIGASAGTVTVQKGDANITLNGFGTLDYRGQQNQADYGYNSMICIFNKVRNLVVADLRMINCPKYCIYWGNLQQADFRNLTINSASAAIQGIGLGLQVYHHNIQGQTSDDFIAYTNDNTDYTEFNFPNGDLTGSLNVFVCRDIVCCNSYTDAVALYGDIADRIDGVFIDGVTCTLPPGRYVYLDAPGSISSTFGAVTIKNLIGPPATDAAVRVGGQATPQVTMDSISIVGFDFGLGPVNTPILFTGPSIIGSILVDGQGARIRCTSAGTQRYGVQLNGAAGSSYGSVEIRSIEFTNSSGGSGTYILSPSGAHQNINIHDCKMYGTASSLGGGAPTGTPIITVNSNYFDAYNGIAVYFACRLFFVNNKFGAIGGGSACILAYDNSYSCDIRAYGNYWSNANNWLQLGVSAGDTLVAQVWASGNGANGGFGTAINFTTSSGGLYLRQSDAALPMNAAKWTAIDAGCVYQNNNGAFDAGKGIYAQGDAPARLAAMA